MYRASGAHQPGSKGDAKGRCKQNREEVSSLRPEPPPQVQVSRLAVSAAQGPPGHRLLFLALHKAPGSRINNTWPSPQT